MSSTTITHRDGYMTRRPDASRFLMWLYIGATGMIFAGLTSAYIVSRADLQPAGHWRAFQLPQAFWLSTLFTVLSSASLVWAVRAGSRNRMGQLTGTLALTLLLGLLFLFTQFLGWRTLVQAQLHLVGGSNAEAYVYVLTFLHALHLVGGLVALVVQFFRAVTYRIHARQLQGLKLAATFWHAMGVLWVYLFLFLTIQHG